MTCRLEPVTLRHMWPRAPRAKIDSICAISEEVFEGIDDYGVIAEFMGNVSHENGAGTIVRESGNYRSADRILEIFGSPHSSAAVTPHEAQSLVGKPAALFDRVYNLPSSPKLAKALGNHLPGDGFKFRGAGDLQSTGRAAMARLAKRVGRPELAENPDLLADPALSFRVAFEEFKALGCVPLAKQGKTEAVRRRVNGGTNGMAEVKVWVRRWKQALPAIQEPEKIPRGADTGDKKLRDSTILKGTTVTAATTIGGVAAQLGQASDTLSTVQTGIDTAGSAIETGKVVVKTVQPFLGLMPQVWAGIGIACGVAALVGLGYIAWKRYLKYRDEGV